VGAANLPTFDLVLATVGRTAELSAFLDSLEAQTHRQHRLIVVDQNDDDRVSRMLADRRLDVLHLYSERGLSRARNCALPHVTADVVAFPDDDCVYPAELLERVARRLAAERVLTGLTGRAVDRSDRSSSSWKTDAAVLTEDNLWNRAISYTIFLRRELVESLGRFDEELGLGAQWTSGEEIDYLVRAVRAGARLAYDPELTVTHDERPLDSSGLSALGYRDGASVGYILRKHGYPRRMRARMIVRPVGGALLSLVRLDPTRARYHIATLHGRVRGLRGDGQEPA
jgi:glycosyltransferase involved in cell wall biosynthesis